MTTEEAWRIIGNQPSWAIHNMVKALKMHRWLNSSEDEERLKAGEIALKTKNPRYN